MMYHYLTQHYKSMVYLCGEEVGPWSDWIYPSSDHVGAQMCPSCSILHMLNPEDTLDCPYDAEGEVEVEVGEYD